MGLHKPFDRSFYLIGGATMTDGFSLNLAKGQFGIFDVQATSKKGAKAVSSFVGQPKNKTYELRLGKTDLPVTRSQNNKSFSSFPFSLNNVLDLQVSVPEITEQKVDEVIVGYNGIDDSTAITFKEGDLKKLNLELKGEPIGLLGYPNGVNIPVYMEVDNCSSNGNSCDDCDECAEANCAPIILKAIETLKNHQLRGGTLVTDYVDITPIRECENAPEETLIDYTFYNLQVCDTGDETALALVQAQYPDLKVVRTGRNGAISTYEILQPDADDAPSDFTQTLASVLGDCDGCPTGYTEVEGGLIYGFTLEDEGIDESATIEAELTNAVKASVVKVNAQLDGKGYYTAVLTAEIDDTEFESIVAALPTITINYIGEAQSICNPDSSTAISWVSGDSCSVTTRSYTIDLPDTECGEDRLAELQSAFPDLDISIAQTDDAEPVNITGGCKTRYITTVETNMVCEECDPIFEDYFTSEAPASYDLAEWKLVTTEDTSTNCKCGIRFKGKVLEVHPDECLRDELGFVDSSVQIRVSGGYVTEVREGIGEIVDNPFNVEYKSRWKRRTHLGGNLWNDEDRNRVFFTGEARHEGDLVARMFKGEESHIQADKQYVDYALTVRRNHYSQSFSGLENETITYHIYVEVGRQQAVEELL
ncbi:MAG: hypothetical protein PQJ49_03130, partial [Sphaerochaetaceae bacterium]|nr:hypothetical protein [Sphaerochaetaceae bacterium]